MPPHSKGHASRRSRPAVQQIAEDVLETLSQMGLLLQQDKHVKNVVTLVTGETLRGSWWAHPKGQLIFAVLSDLAGHPDVLFTKLLDGKVTLVHRRLWPALLAVALENAPWQMKGLSKQARALLAATKEPVAASGPVVKELEQRLLAHTEQVHTESGRHEIVVQTWSRWAAQAGVKPLRSVAKAKKQIEEAAIAIGAELARLPWVASC